MENQNLIISDEVIATVASIAATGVEGVAGMSGTLANGIAELLGKKNSAKGVKVNANKDFVEIDLFIVTDYGVHIPEVAAKVQKHVKEEVESMTGLTVINVNVTVDAITIQKD